MAQLQNLAPYAFLAVSLGAAAFAVWQLNRSKADAPSRSNDDWWHRQY